MFGLIVLYSTSSYNGQARFGDPAYYLKKQLFATALGLAAMYGAAGLDYHRLQKLAPWGYLLSLALSGAVLLVGDAYNGSRRWLSIGPLSFQPSEYAKLAVILLLASLVSGRKNNRGPGMMGAVLGAVLPIVALVGDEQPEHGGDHSGHRPDYDFYFQSPVSPFCMDYPGGHGFYGGFSGNGAVPAGAAGSLERPRKTMKKASRPFRGCTPSVPEAYSERGWGTASRSWDLSRKPRTI